MIKLDIKVDTKNLTLALNRLAKELEEKALVRALNKTAQQARTEAAREVRAAGYNIKASAVKDALIISKAKKGRLMAVLKASGKPIAMINYGARQTQNGVSVQVKGKRTLLKHAFIVQMKSGHRGVYERVGQARIKGAKKTIGGRLVRANLPIRELFGPSIPSALANDAVRAATLKKIREKFPKILEHELKFIALKKR